MSRARLATVRGVSRDLCPWLKYQLGNNSGDNGMYDNATKETWRGFVWNQVAERLKRTPGACSRVCVLAGDIGGDVAYARARKLECIGIDYDEDKIRTFRRVGGVGVADELEHQLFALQPRVLIADMTGGLTACRAELFVYAVAMCDVVVFNLLRGREGEQGTMQWFDSLRNACPEAPEYIGRQRRSVALGKHRGRLLWAWGLWRLMELTAQGKGVEVQCGGDIPCKIERHCNELGEAMRPRFMTYRSRDDRSGQMKNNQYFDTVVVTTSHIAPLGKDERKEIWGYAPIKSRRKAAAAKAVLTRRRQLGIT